MRILFIQVENAGGIQLYTSRLANALATTNEVHLLLGKRLYNPNYYSQDIHFHFLNSPQSYLKMLFLSFNPATYINMIRTINKIHPDVIHIALPFLWVAVILPFLRRYPAVVTEHDPELHSGTLLAVRAYMAVSIRLTRKLSDAIIVHGKKMKEIVVKTGIPTEKIYIFPHGEFSFYKKWEQPGLKEEKSVLYFGKISEYKGLNYLVEAGPLIVSEAPGTRIVIAGNGDITKYLPEEGRKEYFVILNRHIPDEDVAGLFQRAAVVVLPYIDGTQSGVVPLAFSFGKPVVVTNVGSIGEEVDEGQTGYIVPPRNAKAIAEAVVVLLNNDELRKKMGMNALSKIDGELSWNSIAHKTEQLYEVIIHQHKKTTDKLD